MMNYSRLQPLAIHPTTQLFGWLCVLVIVQFLQGYVLATAFLAVPFLGRSSLLRAQQLLRRTRWLLLSLFVIFAWGVAGEPLCCAISGALLSWLPTQEGVQEALMHVARIILVLLVLATFLEHMSLPDLLAATHRLLKPLRRIGIDAERGVVRLMLVLRYVESLPRPKDWRSVLQAPTQTHTEQLEVNDYALRWYDIAIMLFLASMLMLLLLLALSN